jgi:hypothetical protein
LNPGHDGLLQYVSLFSHNFSIKIKYSPINCNIFPSHTGAEKKIESGDEGLFHFIHGKKTKNRSTNLARIDLDKLVYEMCRLKSWLYPTHYTITEIKMAAVTEWGDRSFIPYSGMDGSFL